MKKTAHPTLLFNNFNQLKFDDHIKMVFRKISKTIGLLCKLHNFLPRAALITIYKAFIRPHLDYGDMIYDQAYNVFSSKAGIHSV